MQDPNSESSPHLDPDRDELARDHADQVSTLAELGAMAPLYAHEMNNLMTHLSGRAQLALLHADQPELIAQALDAVVEGCQRAAQLAELFLATSTAANPILTETHFDLAGSVDRLTRQHPRQSLLPGIATNDQSEDLIPAIPTLVLEQVLDNLIRNAWRAIDEHPQPDAPHHGITISLTPLPCSTWNNASEQHQLKLIVEDTGIGMKEQQIAAVLRGQEQAGQPNPSHPRHGLGLRVCSLLIKQVGGSLRCESTPNVGTRMIIHLPGAPAAVDPQTSDSDAPKRAA